LKVSITNPTIFGRVFLCPRRSGSWVSGRCCLAFGITKKFKINLE